MASPDLTPLYIVRLSSSFFTGIGTIVFNIQVLGVLGGLIVISGILSESRSGQDVR